MPASYPPNHPQNCNCGICYTIWIEHCSGKAGDCYCQPCQKRNNVDFRHPSIVDTRFNSAHRNNYSDYSHAERAPKTMATIDLCDRCESMMKSTAKGQMDYLPNQNSEWTNLSLCPGCISDLMLFMKDVTTPREKAYKEPWTPKDDEKNGDVVTDTTLRAVIKELLSGDGE